jgi:hypothetical protein
VTTLGIMAAEMRKDRDTHAPEELDQIILERMVLQREIRLLVPEWNHRKREAEKD